MRTNWIIGLALVAGLLAGCGVETTVEPPPATNGADGAAGGTGSETPSALTTLAITAETATIGFVGTKDDGRHDGGFKEVSGTASFDPADLTSMRFSLVIETGSMWSDNEEKLTGHLKSPDFFDVNVFPTATFATTGVTTGADGTYTVDGELTLHGVTKPISFPAEIMWTDPILTVTAKFTINRQDFGMSYGTGKVHDDVSISASFSGKR